MSTSRKRIAQRILVSLSSLCLALSLIACGSGGGASPTSTPTSAPTQAPMPTPTPAPQLQTYTGTGFTIQYPGNWTVQTIQGAIVFTDAQKLNTVTIAIAPNPGGAISADKQASAAVVLLEKSVSDPQPVNLPATTTVAGESWVQKGITGTATSNGVSGPAEIVVLATNHPASSPLTKTYEIYYGGPTLSFQQENQLVFQPMLQTFKFTA